MRALEPNCMRNGKSILRSRSTPICRTICPTLLIRIERTRKGELFDIVFRILFVKLLMFVRRTAQGAHRALIGLILWTAIIHSVEMCNSIWSTRRLGARFAWSKRTKKRTKTARRFVHISLRCVQVEQRKLKKAIGSTPDLSVAPLKREWGWRQESADKLSIKSVKLHRWSKDNGRCYKPCLTSQASDDCKWRWVARVNLCECLESRRCLVSTAARATRPSRISRMLLLGERK